MPDQAKHTNRPSIRPFAKRVLLSNSSPTSVSYKSLPQVLARQSATWEPGTIIPACPPVFPLPDTLVLPKIRWRQPLPVSELMRSGMIQRLKGGGDTPARQRFNNKDSTTSSTPITMAPPRCLTQKCQQHLVAQSLPADPAPKWGIAGHHRREDSPQCICEPDLGIHPPASSALLIPAVLRPNVRYVKSFVRGCRCGITAARSSCPKLRMLSAATIRVPASKWDKHHDFRQRRLTAAMVGTEPQPAKHSLPLALLHLSERCPAAARNSSCFKMSAPAIAR